MSNVSGQFELGFGVAFHDLYAREGLLRLDAAFLAQLAQTDSALHSRLTQARANPSSLAAKEQSELIIALAPHVEDFLGQLFGITAEIQALQARHNQFAPFFAFKRKFIQKRAISGVTKEQAATIDGPNACSRTGGALRRTAHRTQFLHSRFRLARQRTTAFSRHPDRRALCRLGCSVA